MKQRIKLEDLDQHAASKLSATDLSRITGGDWVRPCPAHIRPDGASNAKLGTDGSSQTYRAEVVPWLWF